MTHGLPIGFARECSDCPIRHRAVCSRCEGDELARLNELKFYKNFEPGQTVALRGEALDYVATIVIGTATLERVTEDGRTQIVGVLLPSDFLGRPGRHSLGYDITAVGDVTLCCFRRKPFETLLEEIPNLRQRLLDLTMDELDAARDWMLLLGRKTAREKIASFLLLLADRCDRINGNSTRGGRHFELPVSRESIANFTGLTIETVSRQVSTLRREGLIVLQGVRHVTVPDTAALRRAAGDDDANALN
ncbi:MAG: Crp/Fnr family transcriptional regulator [Pseudomonadota bacterium]